MNNFDDGLTDEEREFITTPMSQMSTNDRLTAIAMRDKKANYIYAENDKWRQQKEAELKAKRYG